MIFRNTRLKGAFVVEIQKLEDERGFFARSWCRREFEDHGLDSQLVQCNISFNKIKGTLRGMHYQMEPFEEDKVVRCSRGAIYDVIIDLRPGSPTFKQYEGFYLTAENHMAVFVPKLFAHGFLTLADNTEVFYQMSQFYAANAARGVRWNDPAFGIEWPMAPVVISERDRTYPDFVTIRRL